MELFTINTRNSSKEKSTYAARLDQALTAAGIPPGRYRMSTLAAKFAVTPETARQWLKGRIPGVNRLIKLATRLNVSMDWLATGRGNRQIQNSPEAVEDNAKSIERELVGRVLKLSPRHKRALFDLLNPEL